MTPPAVTQWLFEEVASSFAFVFESLAGARPDHTTETLATPPAFAGATFGWSQPLTSFLGEAFLAASEEDVIAWGQQAMLAAGVEDASEDEKKSTFLESIKQVFSSLGRALSARMEQEVVPQGGRQSANLPDDGVWGVIRLKVASQPITLYVAVPVTMVDVLRTELESIAADGISPVPVGSSVASAVSVLPGAHPQTFDLLLDVELPVSVSFGHAQVPLKDVLKLTTGSIVELSRAMVEPVDVVVNNCVIAKGEVVVVEGNFGVRILHVVSRSERLRTLQ
jgi:flagellar motor switch protein FliN/FliY